jgi:hypothetical protein
MQMQTIITNDAGIHCKVSCNDQFRRFLFVGTEFCSLFSQIQQLLSLNKEFVLKYKDNEGDLITISSNEELTCALSYSEGSVLRLTATVTDQQQPTAVGAEHTHEFPACHFYGRRGGRCHGRGRHGRFGQDNGAPRFGPEAFKERLTYKRDMIQSRLAEFAQGELDPSQQFKQAWLKEKLVKIEGRLAKLEEGGCGRWERHSSKWEVKAEKHKNRHCGKMEKKMKKEKYGHGSPEKREKVVLSEETQAQIAGLKSQVVALKPSFKEVKYQIKAKKEAIKEAKAVGGNTEQLYNEIALLKEVHKGQKNQIRPLKEQIHALKHA